MMNSESVKVRIDIKRTGEHLKKMISDAEYSVSDIQKYLELSCPQPVYRWFKGKILPSVDHLLSLAFLLNCHMDELLVVENDKRYHVNPIEIDLEYFPDPVQRLRWLLKYRELLEAWS